MKKLKLITLCSLMAFGVGGAIVSCGPKDDNKGDVGGLLNKKTLVLKSH